MKQFNLMLRKKLKIRCFNMNWHGLLKFDGSIYAIVCPSCSKETDNILTPIDLKRLDPIKQCIMCDISVRDFNQNERN